MTSDFEDRPHVGQNPARSFARGGDTGAIGAMAVCWCWPDSSCP